MTGKRKERAATFNRSNILESANELFLQKGIEKTTMDDIARHAEYSKSTIYNYFESKEEIVCYLVFEGLEFFQTKLIEDAEKCSSFSEFYRRFCKSALELYEKYPIYYVDIAEALAIDRSKPASDIRKKIYMISESINDTIEEQLAKGVALNEIDADDDISSSVILLRFVLMNMVQKAALNEDYVSFKLGKTKDEFLDFSFKKIYNLLARNSPLH